ncbi:hypothetical protein [Actinomyces massiliensis]|uniref:hypothetical protein n=1 Tax=Actinomyces massiliensis TaxID=461393 RepID=UPI0028F16B46|nr:hypothetical protein [Actinomyces massiliensis]
MTTTHLGNAAVILGYNNLPYPLEDAFTAGMGDHRDSYDIEGICAEARKALEAALPEGITLVGDELFIEVTEWPNTVPLPEGWAAAAAGALDEDTLYAIWARHERTTS